MHRQFGWFGHADIDTITKSELEVAPEWGFASGQIGYLPAAQPSWMSSVWERLQELQELPADWNGYGELPIALEAVAQTAKLLNDVGPMHQMPDIVPLPDGGLQIEWSGSGCELEIEVGPHGARSAFFVNDQGQEQGFEVANDVSEVQTLVAAMG